MEIVGEGLGEVFPGVGRRVGRNERVLPVGGRALAVVAVERCTVVGGLVSEERAEVRENRRIGGDQPIEIIVPDLVADVAEGER